MLSFKPTFSLSSFAFIKRLFSSSSCTGEGNGNPLQCSCLENPRDGRAWWGAVYGVAQSQTQLKQQQQQLDRVYRNRGRPGQKVQVGTNSKTQTLPQYSQNPEYIRYTGAAAHGLLLWAVTLGKVNFCSCTPARARFKQFSLVFKC